MFFLRRRPQVVPEQECREDTIDCFKAIASQGTYHAVLFVSAVNSAPFDVQLLDCFMPSLKLVAGLGAGFDHGKQIRFSF